jgi:hypothetical protein
VNGHPITMISRKWVSATLLSVILGTGCGAGEQEAGAAAAVDEFVSSLDSPGTACRLLAPETVSSLESKGESCAEALPDLRLPDGRARDATVWSERALVHTSSDTLFLVELDTGWRVTAAGCVPAADVSYDCVVS